MTADDIVSLFEEDVRARRRLAELLVAELDVRLALANAILKEVATKADLEKLEGELRREISQLGEETTARVGSLEGRLSRLEDRMGGLEQSIARVEGQVILLIKVFIAFNLPMLMALIGVLLKLAL